MAQVFAEADTVGLLSPGELYLLFLSLLFSLTQNKMSQTEKKVSIFCSQCLDKHITSQPLNRANGMSRGELIEMQQLQRLTRNAEVTGPR